MITTDVFPLREIFNAHRIMLCFNGPFTAALIDELGKALRNYMEGLEESPSSVSDVFSVYIELTQNIRNYTLVQQLDEDRAISTVMVSRLDERYVVSSGNVVRLADGEALAARISELAGMDKADLKAAFKTQLRQPRDTLTGPGAGLGLIDMARKASEPMTCSLRPLDEGYAFFSLRVVL